MTWNTAQMITHVLIFQIESKYTHFQSWLPERKGGSVPVTEAGHGPGGVAGAGHAAAGAVGVVPLLTVLTLQTRVARQARALTRVVITVVRIPDPLGTTAAVTHTLWGGTGKGRDIWKCCMRCSSSGMCNIHNIVQRTQRVWPYAVTGRVSLVLFPSDTLMFKLSEYWH